MDKSTVKINLQKYLVEFVKTQLGAADGSIEINRESFIGGLIYDRLEKIPDGCIFRFEPIPKKAVLEINILTIGGRNEKRIYADRNQYYVSPGNQRSLEFLLTDYFNNLFYNTLDFTIEYTEAQMRKFIEDFCDKYNLDYADCYEMLKKRYYRYRMDLSEKQKNMRNISHTIVP